MRLRDCALQVAQQPRELQHGRGAAGIVVGAGRVLGAVVMRADHDDLRIGSAGGGSITASMLRTVLPSATNSCRPTV